MTAIYAYARNRVAFVAGDTVRYDPIAGRQTVCKLHHWSDSVVLAQAGEARMLSKAIQRAVPLSGFLQLPPTGDGFIQAFERVRPGCWAEAQNAFAARNAGNPPPGTVLIAEAATDHTAARVLKLDFETGALTPSVGFFDADGTDVDQFRTIAQFHLDALQADGHDQGIPLDVWAARCVQNAAEAHPRYIGFPADVLIGRPSAARDRILVYRRVPCADVVALDLFRAQ
jgi:hypothetical protein